MDNVQSDVARPPAKADAARDAFHTLPGGEGRGEGEGDVIARHGTTHAASSTRLTPKAAAVQQRIRSASLELPPNRLADASGRVRERSG